MQLFFLWAMKLLGDAVVSTKTLVTDLCK
jgi:hypothetical protein